jgi:hypothetical protein
MGINCVHRGTLEVNKSIGEMWAGRLYSYYSRNGSESYTTQGLFPPLPPRVFDWWSLPCLLSSWMDQYQKHGEKDESRAKIKWKRKGDDDGGMWTNKQKRRTRPADRMNGPAQHANPVHQKIGLSVWLRLALKPLVHPACSTRLSSQYFASHQI